MSSARLASGIWVDAYRARLAAEAIPLFVLAKGDETAGAILVKLNTLDGRACAFQRGLDGDGERAWIVLAEGPEAEVDAALARQRLFDPDLWIVEVEDRQGRHMLDSPGLGA
ncbi:MAG: DUF1491 family protein [Pseudomonadota bacterium]